jgi:hypothetical protein
MNTHTRAKLLLILPVFWMKWFDRGLPEDIQM